MPSPPKALPGESESLDLTEERKVYELLRKKRFFPPRVAGTLLIFISKAAESIGPHAAD